MTETNPSVSGTLFGAEQRKTNFINIDYDTLIDAKFEIRIGSQFLDRPAAKVFDFSQHASHHPIVLSNKLVTEVYERQMFGVAASQFGIDYRVIVVAGIDEAMFNPAIIDRGGKVVEMEEVSNSLPLARLKISRPEHIEIRFLDSRGTFHKRKFTGMTARILQQLVEIIDGKSLLDHVSDFKKKKLIVKCDRLVNK